MYLIGKLLTLPEGCSSSRAGRTLFRRMREARSMLACYRPGDLWPIPFCPCMFLAMLSGGTTSCRLTVDVATNTLKLTV